MPIRRARTIALSAVTAALILVPSAATAQSMTGAGASLGWSKSEAILGAPSALQAVLSDQGAPAPKPTLAPASYSVPHDAAGVAGSGDEGILSGRPDLFGSVALKVGHTPLDARWRAVEHQAVAGNAARFAAALKGAAPLKQLEAVNAYVNGRVQFEDDQRRFGRGDVWSSANETLGAGRGDCEDFAIAKMQLLRAAGFSSRDLYLVILRDTVRRADHAVLVARAAGRMVVLDNGTDQLLDTDRVSDYRPILTFASYGEWTHGYRVPSTQVAADDGDQRSRSASLRAFSTGFKR
jgi:predicted transglutaminase-like cysteine proteinase